MTNRTLAQWRTDETKVASKLLDQMVDEVNPHRLESLINAYTQLCEHQARAVDRSKALATVESARWEGTN